MNQKKRQNRIRKNSANEKNQHPSIIRRINSHTTYERKQLEGLLYGLRTEFYIDVEKAKRAILEKIQATEHSIELIAQELNRRDSNRKTDGKDVVT